MNSGNASFVPAQSMNPHWIMMSFRGEIEDGEEIRNALDIYSLVSRSW